MGARDDRLMLARADLCARVDRLAADLPRLGPDQIVTRVQTIRRSAHGYGLCAVESIAGGFADALGESGRGVMMHAYLAAMRDAVGCERIDAAAGDAYLAAVAVRLAS